MAECARLWPGFGFPTTARMITKRAMGLFPHVSWLKRETESEKEREGQTDGRRDRQTDRGRGD